MTKDKESLARDWKHGVVWTAAILMLLLVAGCGGESYDMESGSTMMEAPAPNADAYYEMEEDSYESESSGGEYTSNSASVALDERKLVFTGNMALRVADTLVAMAAATTWAEANDGFIEQSSTSEWEPGVSGQLTMRVPSESFEDARAHLRSLADDVLSDVKSRQDVTGQHADYSARLKNLEAAEEELRQIMAQIREEGGMAEEVLSVHRELTRIRGDIESLQAQLDALSEQVAYSTLVVSFEPIPAEPEIVTDEWRPMHVLRRALGDLVGGLQNLADAAIYFAVALLPLLIVLAVGLWVVYKVFRRIRPKSAKASSPSVPSEPSSGSEA